MNRILQGFCFLFICVFFLISCEKKEGEKYSDRLDFERLMGKYSPLWHNIKDEIDLRNLEFFQKFFNEKIHQLEIFDEKEKIPKILHFIWIGPKPFPEKSVRNVYTWVENHPNWEVKLWTDRPRSLPHPQMQLCYIEDFPFEKLHNCYAESTNYGEKSDIFRYELLFREGGLYVDHDVECYQPFDPICHAFDFFCGIEPPHQPVVNGSVTICNNIIGTQPFHPILKQCIDMVQNRWEEGKKMFSQNDTESIINLVAYRTFASFDLSVKELVGNVGKNDMVFPAGYFNRIDGKYGFFAHHYYKTSWFQQENKWEKTVRRRIEYLAKKDNQLIGLISLVGVLNVFIIFYLIFLHRKYDHK